MAMREKYNMSEYENKYTLHALSDCVWYGSHANLLTLVVQIRAHAPGPVAGELCDLGIMSMLTL